MLQDWVDADFPRESCTNKKKPQKAFHIQLPKNQVGPAGIEPTTPCLEGRCSIQLSYGPIEQCEYEVLG